MAEKSYSTSYKEAGVDVTAGYKSVQLMKQDVARTAIPGCLDGIGGFGGLFELNLEEYHHPVLVSGTDGVGTKLKLAFLMDRHDTIGIDCVAMCVNDVICCGAKPLVFLDYIACGKNVPKKIAAIVRGVSDGCVQAGCALVGGETAEHPGLMPEDEYDVAGFSVGAVEKEAILDQNTIQAGDVIVGISSSGVHSNGFSLVRKVFDIDHADLNGYADVLGKGLGETLLTPTRIYVKPILSLLKQVKVKSVAHITGGGFYENMPRSFPKQFNAVIQKGSWNIPPIFPLIQEKGNISEHDMYNTFNMGIGMSVIVSPEDAEETVKILNEAGEHAQIIGYLEAGDHSVVFGE